jgi:hypothetical protein
MRTKTISLLALLLLAVSACTQVKVLVHQPDMSSALTGTNCKLQRELRNQKQETDVWCWAASAHTVIEYLKNERIDQWTLVDTVVREQLDEAWIKAKKKGANPDLADPNCEMAVSTTRTDQPNIQTARTICWTNGWPEKVFDTEKFSVHAVIHPYDWTDPAPQGLSWDQIVAEICADRPMISAIYFAPELGGGAHTVVIGGYNELEDGSQWVHVYDPGFNTLEEDYYFWPYDVYLGAPGVFTHVRDYTNIYLR